MTLLKVSFLKETAACVYCNFKWNVYNTMFEHLVVNAVFQTLNKEQLTRVVQCVMLKRWAEIVINNA